MGAQGRLKSLYSVWNKMRRKETSLPEVYDARALRIIVDDDNGAKKQVWLVSGLDGGLVGLGMQILNEQISSLLHMEVDTETHENAVPKSRCD